MKTPLDVLKNIYVKGLLKKDEPVLAFLNGAKMKLCRIEDGEEEWAGLAWLRDQIANDSSRMRTEEAGLRSERMP